MKTAFLALVLMASCRIAQAQIDAFLPEVEGFPGDTVFLPISVGDLTGQNVRGFMFKILYNEDILDVVGATLSGTIAQGSVIAVNGSTGGEFVVAAANARPLSGAGVITLVRAVLEDEGFDVLEFEYFQFNDGEPEARIFQGSVRSGRSTDSESEEPPTTGFRIHGHYPEPAQDDVTVVVDVPEPSRLGIRVFDVSSREVASRSIWAEAGRRRTVSFRLGGLPGGKYLYRITNGIEADGGLLTVIR